MNQTDLAFGLSWAVGDLNRYRVPIDLLVNRLKSYLNGQVKTRFYGLLHLGFPEQKVKLCMHFQEGNVIRIEFERQIGNDIVQESSAPVARIEFRKVGR